jgi:hypothetical protein
VKTLSLSPSTTKKKKKKKERKKNKNSHPCLEKISKKPVKPYVPTDNLEIYAFKYIYIRIKTSSERYIPN